MKLSVCRVNYRSFRRGKLLDFALGITQGLYAHLEIFVAPPIPPDEFAAIVKGYGIAYKDYESLGITKKTAYLEAVNKLVGALDKLSLYVNSIAQGDISLINLAGFEATSSGSQASPKLEKIITIDVTPSKVNGQVIIETPAIVGKNVTGYGLILKSGEPFGPQDFSDGQLRFKATDEFIFLDFNKSRNKIVSGLDSSVSYIGYMFAVNATGVSPLSDPFTVKSI